MFVVLHSPFLNVEAFLTGTAVFFVITTETPFLGTTLHLLAGYVEVSPRNQVLALRQALTLARAAIIHALFTHLCVLIKVVVVIAVGADEPFVLLLVANLAIGGTIDALIGGSFVGGDLSLRTVFGNTEREKGND